MKKRDLGVSLIAALLIGYGLLATVSAIATKIDDELYIAYIFLSYATGIGMILKKHWARFTAIFITPPLISIIILLPIMKLFKLSYSEQTKILFILIVISAFGLCIFYLTRPNIKEQFK